MALTHHDDVEFMVGDQWQIVGKLLDENGQPLDLSTGVQLGWTLIGPDGFQVSGLADAATLEPQDDGTVIITVPDSLTRTLHPARYLDAIRVWVGTAPATEWIGIILAAADPFHAIGD
jgi:hypothetical protein